ncbi:MAG: MaoC family dehydratase N-terminal domain-containing protein [Nocardia sp.]|nr:MaoC family dehydratase N-terminal domain-containing protein [Nocardia sp.]
MTGFTMAIERGKIREFAQATGSSDPAYLGDPTPHIPPTFLRTASFWEPADAVSPLAELNLDLKRVLHGEQEYEFFGPPPTAGTELTVTQRIESVTEKQGRRGGTMRFVVLAQDFRDPDGNLRAVGRLTLIETGKAPQ